MMREITHFLIRHVVLPLTIFYRLIIKYLFQNKFTSPLYHLKASYYNKKLGHYNTEYLKIPKQSSPQFDVTIVFIPGNPGHIRFYDKFLYKLAVELDFAYDIYGVSHCGHYNGKH